MRHVCACQHLILVCWTHGVLQDFVAFMQLLHWKIWVRWAAFRCSCGIALLVDGVALFMPMRFGFVWFRHVCFHGSIDYMQRFTFGFNFVSLVHFGVSTFTIVLNNVSLPSACVALVIDSNDINSIAYFASNHQRTHLYDCNGLQCFNDSHNCLPLPLVE